MIHPIPVKHDSRAAFGLLLLLGRGGPLAMAQEVSHPDPKPTYEQLEARLQSLEDQNARLQSQYQELQGQPRPRPVAQKQIEPPPSITEIPRDDPDYQFLKLGEGRDYLEAERWRIIDQIEQAIPPLYEPVRPFHGFTLPPGAWRVGLETNFAHNPGNFGRDDFYSLFFDNAEVDQLTTTLSIAYGFEIGAIHDLTATLAVPYRFTEVSGTGHPFQIDPMQMTMDGSGNGMGDVSLTFKKKWLDQGNGPLTFSTFTGVIFPTADDEEEFNSGQTLFVNGMPMAVSANVPGDPSLNVFGRKPGDLFLPRSLQPGNGSWGARLGFGATYQFERSAIHAGAIYDFLADNDGITVGDELRYGVSYVFPPFDSDLFTVDLSVFGIWKGDEEFPGQIVHAERDPATGGPVMNPDGSIRMFTTDRPDFKHGNILFFSPSLVFIPHPTTRIFVSPSVRVLEPEEGPSPAWMVSVGATFTF